LIHVDISKSNELRGQKGHQREITGQLQQNPLKGNWSKYGTIGRRYIKISLFGMFSIAYFGQGKNGSKQNGL
jgi:hypothetical protein